MEPEEHKAKIITCLLLLLTAAAVGIGVWAWKLLTAAQEAEKNVPREKASIKQMRDEQKIIGYLRDTGARTDPIDSLQFHEKLSVILKQIRPGLTPSKVMEIRNPRPFGKLQEIAHSVQMQNLSREEYGKMIFYLEKNLPGLKAKDINIPKWSATDLNRLDNTTVWMVYYVPVKK
jgi:hypothetical protein